MASCKATLEPYTYMYSDETTEIVSILHARCDRPVTDRHIAIYRNVIAMNLHVHYCYIKPGKQCTVNWSKYRPGDYG